MRRPLLRAFAFRMTLRAMVIAFATALLLLPLLRLAGLLSLTSGDMFSLCALVSLIAGGMCGWMALVTGGRIERLTRSNARFERLSRTDELSGLLNRRGFSEALAHAQPGSSLVIVDVDRFKQINDSHGHAVGDAVIRRVSALIAGLAGREQTGRLGGEEFGFLLETGGIDERIELVEHLRRDIEGERFDSEHGAFGVTISAGMAEIDPERHTDQACAAADKALYLAKASGRNRVVHYTRGLTMILDMVAAAQFPMEDQVEAARGTA